MLEFQNVSIYRKERRILDDFSLQVQDGVILGLLGSDNTAKSMLLETASGSRTPDIGQILLNGASIYREKSDAYINFGYMPKIYGFYELLRVEEYFDLFLSLYKINGRYRQRRIDEILELLQLEQYREAFINEAPAEVFPFLCLGKTILHDPEWLLLDEPFANLNAACRSKMVKILLMLQEQGKSMIIHSQFFPEIIDFFTDIAILEEGKAVTSGTVHEVYEAAMKKSPIRMHVIAGMEEALAVLKENDLVDRVTVDDKDVIFRFNGGEREEAELLTDLVASGALIPNYMRDRVNPEQVLWR